jgi:hypothetical protein
MSASNEKPRRANAEGDSRYPAQPARLRYFAWQVHPLGERSLLELFLELVAGANLAAIGSNILLVLGNFTPPAVPTIGRAFE